jgi:hypothetical protein
MTAPVVTSYDEVTNVMTQRCFFIPKANQVNTPQPTGPVFILDQAETTVAVARFRGKATFDDYLSYKAKLMSNLGQKSGEYLTENLLTAGYDSPFVPMALRTNEVILIHV